MVSGCPGAAIAKTGFSVILVRGWIPVLVFLVISPVVGMDLGWAILTAVSSLTRHTERYKAERRLHHLQLASAGLHSLGHETNDAQKTMGIIEALPAAAGHKQLGKAASGFQAYSVNMRSPGGSSSVAMRLWRSARWLRHRESNRLAHHTAFASFGWNLCGSGGSDSIVTFRGAALIGAAGARFAIQPFSH